jgi:sulfopyruvate decarboxylase subunit beta
MKRSEALEIIYPDIQNDIVVTIMGGVALELYTIGHRPNFFYMQHGMGLASSLGMGIALGKPDKRVIVLDGDGSLLMNVGVVSTLACHPPANLIHVVFDNQNLVSIGGHPTATARGVDLAGIAEKAGVTNVFKVDALDAFRNQWTAARERRQLSMIVAKVETVIPRFFHMDLALLENRFEFHRWIRTH